MADATAETATETTESTTTDEAKDETVTVEALQAELEKWKTNSRKNEDRAKENAKKAKELEEIQKAQMSDVERALAEAKDAGRTEALTTVGSRLVDAEFRVATAGRAVDVDAILEGLDRSRFLTDDGEPDAEKITAWVDRIAPAKTESDNGGPLSQIDLGQGTPQRTPDTGVEAFTRSLVDRVGGPRTSH